jgi:hypothetical protein
MAFRPFVPSVKRELITGSYLSTCRHCSAQPAIPINLAHAGGGNQSVNDPILRAASPSRFQSQPYLWARRGFGVEDPTDALNYNLT